MASRALKLRGYPGGLTAVWLVSAVLASSGCVDPCVLSGVPCDGHADCGDGEVCRVQRSTEASCLFAAGRCVVGGCGSVDDCAADQCCDPESNRCVASASFGGPCDPRSCSDCAECSFGICAERGGASCGGDGDCETDQLCRYQRCREVCSYDTDCPQARCYQGACSSTFGTACSEFADCAGLRCVARTPSGAERPGYCTDACQDDSACPLGHYFVCVGGECRMP